MRFRIDGVLHQVYQVPPTVLLAMTSRIKLLGRMDVVEKRRPQDGRIKTRAADGQEIELRLSTLPTAFGEKLVMRIFDPEVVVKTLPDLGFPADDAAALGRADRAAERHHAGDRADRLGQDHHAVHHAQGAGHRRGQRLHGRRPDRDGRAGLQPDAGAERHRPVLRRRRARADAAGPGHHHGGRDPRPGNRRNGDPGGADRPPGAVDAAHQRCAVGRDAPARTGRAALPARGHAGRRDGAAPGAHAVPALQGRRRRTCRTKSGPA